MIDLTRRRKEDPPDNDDSFLPSSSRTSSLFSISTNEKFGRKEVESNESSNEFHSIIPYKQIKLMNSTTTKPK